MVGRLRVVAGSLARTLNRWLLGSLVVVGSLQLERDDVISGLGLVPTRYL